MYIRFNISSFYFVFYTFIIIILYYIYIMFYYILVYACGPKTVPVKRTFLNIAIVEWGGVGAC